MDQHPAIAIVGISCRFPDAPNIDAFWRNLRDGVNSIARFTDEELLANGVDPSLLSDPSYVRANGVVSGFDLFDAQFFGFTPKEARMIDPQQRFFLECAWEALEHAGYDVTRYPGEIGVYAGTGMNTYLLYNVYPHLGRLEALEQFELMIASDKDYVATRVSYKLNLQGPAVSVQSSCSTAMVAVHLACQSLLAGECDMALAGGVSLRPPLRSGYLFREGMIFSPDGYCRAFDAQAGGTVNSNGIGVVVLKRLDHALRDRDTIHAVILGTAINNDGAQKGGYTAPSSHGQAAAVAKAIERAGVPADTITYVEAHGTGTILGDPIEVNGLAEAFRLNTDATQFCALGSVKTNIGHADVAAGMAGLIKTVQALKHKQIPPTLNFSEPNPLIDFENSPFYVNAKLARWESKGSPRRAGVNSLGVGGTNAHAILEEAPALEPTGPSRPAQLLLLSAKNLDALDAATRNLAQYLNENHGAKLADVAYTLQTGRTAFNHRRMLVCSDADEAIRALEDADASPEIATGQDPREAPVIFMFTGQGAQYVNMARGLYDSEPLFRANVEACCEMLIPHLGFDLRDALYPPEGEEETVADLLTQTAFTQPALFVIEYALAQLWMSWGVRPEAMIGHSIGEYTAACLAGVLSLEDALALVAARGRLIQSMPPGSMLAVSLTPEEIEEYLGDSLSLAVVNGPAQCVVSGPTEAIDALEQQLTAREITCQRLHTSHAFHSAMLEPVVEPFIEVAQQAALAEPQIPYISNLTGTWITAEEAMNPAYHAQHMRQTVRFSEGLTTLMQSFPEAVLLEVGPGPTLSTLVRRHPDKGAGHLPLSSVRHPRDQRPDLPFLLGTLGRLWLAGIEIDWQGFYANEHRRRIPLPTYAFQRQRHWLDAPVRAAAAPQMPAAKTAAAPAPRTAPAAQAPANGASHDGSLRAVVAQVWQDVVGVDAGDLDNFFDLGGTSLIAASLLTQIEKSTGQRIALPRFFQAPTIAGLVTLLQEAGYVPSQPHTPAVPEASSPVFAPPVVQMPAPVTRPAAAPQPNGDPLRAVVAQVWQDVVGADAGDEDNFFDLGGTSLIAASLLTQIEKSTGQRIALPRFFQAPTIAGLVALLREAGYVAPQSHAEPPSVPEPVTARPAARMSHIIPMRRGSRPPFFWMHSTDFANLTRFLHTDQPFYCVMPSGLDGLTPIQYTIEGIADYHTEQVLDAYPEGPYMLGGYCLGGYIALEVATRLMAQGREIKALVLVDAPPPDSTRLEHNKRGRLQRATEKLMTGRLLPVVVDKIQEKAGVVRTNLFGSEDARRIQKVVEYINLAFKKYAPDAYPGSATLVVSTSTYTRDGNSYLDRWAQIITGGCDLHLIPGDHNTMLRMPHSADLGAAVNTALQPEGEAVIPTEDQAMSNT